jgi:hypothetical protein
MTSNRTVRIAAGLLILAGATALTGCSHVQARGTRYHEVHSSLTPELLTLDQTYVDANRELTLAIKTNMRTANDDLARAAYVNRPSRLTFFPIPH